MRIPFTFQAHTPAGLPQASPLEPLGSSKGDQGQGPPPRKQPPMLSVTPEEFCRKSEAVVQVVLQGQADSGNSPNSAAPHPVPGHLPAEVPLLRPQPAPHTQAGQAPLRDSCSRLGDPDSSPPASGGAPDPRDSGIRMWKALGPIPTPLSVLGSPPRQLGAPLPELLAVLGGHRSGPGGRPGRWVTGAPRDRPPGPRNLRASPGRFPAAGHPLPAPGGAILDVGTPPAQRRCHWWAAQAGGRMDQ